MSSLEDSTYTPGDTEHTSGAIERHAVKRRDFIEGRRQSMLHQKHTDTLPQVNGDTANGKITARQVMLLREENKRLRRDFNALQAHFDKEMEADHNSHQQGIEQYQHQLRELMEERKHMHEARLELEQRYQELYHSFQDAVEEETHKVLKEAVNTVELTPEHTPPLLRDVRRTIELQSRQVQDQHVAQALYLMREAQHKAQQMEQELDHERLQLVAERESLAARQKSIRTQAKLRFDAQKARLRTQWNVAVTAIVMVVATVVLLFQIVLQATLHSLGGYFSLFVSILISGGLAFILARLWTHIIHFHLKTKGTPTANTEAKK